MPRAAPVIRIRLPATRPVASFVVTGYQTLLQKPASTGKVTPVTYFASSETR